MKHRLLYATVMALCLAGPIIWFVGSRTVSGSSGVSDEQVGSPGRSPGSMERAVYDMSWAAAQSRRFGNEDGLAGKLELKGRLELVTLPSNEGKRIVVARLYDLKSARLELLGKSIDAAKLEDARASVTSSRDGALEELATPEDADATVGHVLWGLFSRMQVTSPPRRRERTPLGVREVRYGKEGAEHMREGVRYVSVDGIPNLADLKQELVAETRFKLAAGGHLERLDAAEQLTVSDDNGTVLDSKSRLSLELVEHGVSASIPSTAGFVTRDVDSATRRADAKALAARAQGVSRDNVIGTLRSFSGRASVTDLPGWLWQASGRLLLEPDVSKEIVSAVTSGDLGLEGMRLATDLLAGAGHPEAQSAMRDIFSYLYEENAAALVELVQRAGFLSMPEPATVSFVKDLFESEKGTSLHQASGYTLGSMADKLWSKGHQEESRELTDLLEGDLASADTPEERADVIRSMGNAGTPDVADEILAGTDSGESVEREAAASASRKLDSDDATHRLIELLTDPHPGVQRAAINALRGRLTERADYGRVRDAVLSGRTHTANDPLLVNLVSARTDLPEVSQALQFILDRSGNDPRLRARLRKILASQ